MSGLDAALDALYGADPGEFVAIRKQLAAELRAAGDKDGAKQLLGARRPSTAAGARNQLARREPDLVETLLDRARELVAAQTRALSGNADAMRDAIRAHRTALDAATDAALAILGARANDGFRDEIVSTLRAASTDDDVARLVRTGRVIREASASGFPDVVGLTLVPDLVAKPASREQKAVAVGPAPPAATKVDERAAAAERKREAEVRREAERAREREAQRRAMLAARDDALARAAIADAEAADATARLESLRREVAEAEHQREAARERSRIASAEAARLTKSLE